MIKSVEIKITDFSIRIFSSNCWSKTVNCVCEDSIDDVIRLSSCMDTCKYFDDSVAMSSMTRDGAAMETVIASTQNPMNVDKETSKYGVQTPKSLEKVTPSDKISYFKVFTCTNFKAVCRRFPVTFAALVVLPILGFIVVGICYAIGTPQCTNILGAKYSYPLNYNRALPIAMNNNMTYNIVLFGDSLINFGILEMGLAQKMQSFLPDFKLNIANYGVDSDVIQLMHDRVDDMLTNTKYVLCSLSHYSS
jgi:hypothetical protein